MNSTEFSVPPATSEVGVIEVVSQGQGPLFQEESLKMLLNRYYRGD